MTRRLCMLLVLILTAASASAVPRYGVEVRLYRLSAPPKPAELPEKLVPLPALEMGLRLTGVFLMKNEAGETKASPGFVGTRRSLTLWGCQVPPGGLGAPPLTAPVLLLEPDKPNTVSFDEGIPPEYFEPHGKGKEFRLKRLDPAPGIAVTLRLTPSTQPEAEAWVNVSVQGSQLFETRQIPSPSTDEARTLEWAKRPPYHISFSSGLKLAVRDCLWYGIEERVSDEGFAWAYIEVPVWKSPEFPTEPSMTPPVTDERIFLCMRLCELPANSEGAKP